MQHNNKEWRKHILSFRQHPCHHPSCQFHLLLHRCSCLCTDHTCEPCACAAVLSIWQLCHVLLDDSVINKHTGTTHSFWTLNNMQHKRQSSKKYLNKITTTCKLQSIFESTTFNYNTVYNVYITIYIFRSNSAKCQQYHTNVTIIIIVMKHIAVLSILTNSKPLVKICMKKYLPLCWNILTTSTSIFEQKKQTQRSTLTVFVRKGWWKTGLVSSIWPKWPGQSDILPAHVWQRDCLSITPWRGSIKPFNFGRPPSIVSG